jgi:hypothetical protein
MEDHMPPKTGTAATAPADSGKAPASKPARAARKPAARRSAAAPESIRTLAQMVGARGFESHGEADNQGLTRSFHLTVGDVERAKATSDGVQHRAYGTAIEDDIPKSLSAFVTEAIRVACTYYEDLLNDGQEFRRIRNLSPGPSPEGARRGAAKRAASRNASNPDS